ncbi:hypothetical protein [Streptomyces sp. NPDC088760]
MARRLAEDQVTRAPDAVLPAAWIGAPDGTGDVPPLPLTGTVYADTVD